MEPTRKVTTTDGGWLGDLIGLGFLIALGVGVYLITGWFDLAVAVQWTAVVGWLAWGGINWLRRGARHDDAE